MGKANVLTVRDVTKEYFDSATPGQGCVTYEDGYKVGGHQAEIAIADWLHRTFGGDIKLLKEASENDRKRADYLWHGTLWELKCPSSINAADKRLQYAVEQIKDNPGGVIIDIQEDLDMIALERQLKRRMNRSKLDYFDLLLLQKGELKKVLSHKKIRAGHSGSQVMGSGSAPL